MTTRRGPRRLLSESAENYLKAILQLRESMERVSTTALAEHFGVAPASVTGMLKKLASEKPALVDYVPRGGVDLSPRGRQIALEMLRHHRLIELYLHEELGYELDEVHAEAERLEHFISEKFEDRIAALLGHPEFDPHGDPIPSKNGDIPEAPGECLAGLPIGQSGLVARVNDRDPDVLRYLLELGIKPAVTLTVTDRGPFDGPVHVRIGENEEAPVHALGLQVANQVFVNLHQPEAASPSTASAKGR